MTRYRTRVVASGAAVLVALGGVSWSASALAVAAPSRGDADAQCHFESPSGKVRIWWDEDRPDTVLQGEDGGAASDGRCATVPASVPWMASQLEALMREFTAAGLPLPKSDRGIQRIDQRLSDNGSGAYDVYLDGSSNDYSGGSAQCAGVQYYQAGRWRYRTLAIMQVSAVPAALPSGGQASLLRQVLAHELAHSVQCAVTNAARKINGSSLSGPWIEAVPQALAMGRVGGSWDVDRCDQQTALLSPRSSNAPRGYGQWPFWYSLLGGPSHSPYPALLREVIRAPLSKAGPQLTRVVRERFTTTQISRALLDWATASYLGGTLTAANGAPITWRANSLLDSFGYLVDESTGAMTPKYWDPLVGEIFPEPGGSATMAVTVAPLTCAALLVPWPDGAETLSVGATGAPGGELANVMAVGLDVAPGTPATARCGTDGPRTRIPLTGSQFTAARPCDGRGFAPRMWVLMVNGGTAPLTLSVTATAT